MKLNIQLFAHTNATTNYELPQFVGTDKPTWLGDFNEAMSDIDAGMHENASDIASMESDVANAVSTASQASQDVTTLTGTVNTLSGTVSSVQTTANNASQTASSALNTANTANGKADTNASAITTINGDIDELSDKIDDFSIYSTTEKVVGTWINGKPIYRKVFTFTTPSGNNDYIISTNIANVGTVLSCTGGITEANGVLTPIPDAIDFSGTIYATSFRITNGDIYYKGNSAYGSKPAFAILEYTKTTD